MDLKTFVKESLLQIVKGVEEAGDEAGAGAIASNASVVVHGTSPIGTTLNGQLVSQVDFDVSVTADESKGEVAKAGIMVIPFGLVGEKKSEISSSSFSRIRFSVTVTFPKS